jgi:hypothetical protein
MRPRAFEKTAIKFLIAKAGNCKIKDGFDLKIPPFESKPGLLSTLPIGSPRRLHSIKFELGARRAVLATAILPKSDTSVLEFISSLVSQ